MSRRHTPRWGLYTLSIILIGLLLRMYHLTSRSLWLDEALCVQIASMPNIKEMFSTIINEIHPPLFYLLLRSWITVFENTDLSVRMFTALWGALGLVGVYFLCRYGLRWDRKASNLATALALALPIHAYYSQEVRPYSMSFALCCFALAFLFQAHRSLRIRSYIVFGILQALLLYTHHTLMVYLFVVNLVYLIVSFFYKELTGIRFKGFALALFTTLLLYSPWVVPLLKQLKNPTLFSGFWFWVPQPSLSDVTVALAKIMGVWKLTLPFEVTTVFYLIFATPMLILVLLGTAYSLTQKSVGETILLVVFLGYPLLVYILSNTVLPIWLIRILIPSAIGVPILAASAVLYCSHSTKATYLFSSVFVLGLFLSLFTTVNLLHSYQKEDWKGIAEFLANHVGETDSVFVYREYYAIPLERYCHNRFHIQRLSFGVEPSSTEFPEEFSENVTELADDSEMIFLVLSELDVSKDALLKVMSRSHRFEAQRNFYRIRLFIFNSLKRKDDRVSVSF